MEIKNKINKKQNGNLNKVLYNISKAANSAITLQEIYNIIYKELNTVIDANNLHIALLDKDKVFLPILSMRKTPLMSKLTNLMFPAHWQIIILNMENLF